LINTWKLWLAALATLAMSACMTPPPVNRSSAAPLLEARTVQLDRYLGRWHEAARLPNSFERDCVAALAEYTAREDGMVGVLNTCRKGDGALDQARGRARFVEGPNVGKLEVSFFGPFWGDYWVIDLASDYSWAIVGEPSGRYLWILTRAPRVDATQKTMFEERLRALGYEPNALYWNQGEPL